MIIILPRNTRRLARLKALKESLKPGKKPLVNAAALFELDRTIHSLEIGFDPPVGTLEHDYDCSLRR